MPGPLSGGRGMREKSDWMRLASRPPRHYDAKNRWREKVVFLARHVVLCLFRSDSAIGCLTGPVWRLAAVLSGGAAEGRAFTGSASAFDSGSAPPGGSVVSFNGSFTVGYRLGRFLQ